MFRVREPHPFTIASAPERDHLEFFIHHLGDWSSRLLDHYLVGMSATVEGPYGRFEPIEHGRRNTLWIAGGVGITPFLAALEAWPRTDNSRPALLYAVRSLEGNLIVDRLRAAETAGKVDLHLFTTATGRLGPDTPITSWHSVNPVAWYRRWPAAATHRSAPRVETEDFDIRQGFGPDRSKEIDDFVRKTVVTRRMAPEL